MARTEIHQYPTPTEWKREVKAKLKAMGRGAHTRLAREIGISTGHLSELLGDEGKRTEHVYKIAEFTGVAYKPPIPSTDASEIAFFLQRLTPRQARELGQMAATGDMTDEEFQARIDAFIRLASGVPRKKK